jgi:hypothetical protein
VTAFIYIASLAFAAAAVSFLGGAFSISGLSKLFSGASMAVCMMASALEFSKFVVAAFLHRTWRNLNTLYRTYLLAAVIVLSAITSMGIFGFLSDAYQTSSVDLISNQIKIDALKSEMTRNTDEIARINRDVDEIPIERIGRKLNARKAAEPLVRSLTQKTDEIAEQIKQMDLAIVDTKTKVGPLIYVAKAFNQDVDTVVKWLILVFVSVFDPLAICLVIATSEAVKLKGEGVFDAPVYRAPPVMRPVARQTAAKKESPVNLVPKREPLLQPEPPGQAQAPAAIAEEAVREISESQAQAENQEEAVEDPITMRFVDGNESSEAS